MERTLELKMGGSKRGWEEGAVHGDKGPETSDVEDRSQMDSFVIRSSCFNNM